MYLLSSRGSSSIAKSPSLSPENTPHSLDLLYPPAQTSAIRTPVLLLCKPLLEVIKSLCGYWLFCANLAFKKGRYVKKTWTCFEQFTHLQWQIISQEQSQWETHKTSGAESNNFPAGLELQAGMSVNMLPSCHAWCHTCWAEGCSCSKLLFTACILLSSIQVPKMLGRKKFTVQKFQAQLAVWDHAGQSEEETQEDWGHPKEKLHCAVTLMGCFCNSSWTCNTKKLVFLTLVPTKSLQRGKKKKKNSHPREDPVCGGSLWSLIRRQCRVMAKQHSPSHHRQIQLCHARGGWIPTICFCCLPEYATVARISGWSHFTAASPLWRILWLNHRAQTQPAEKLK